MYTHTWVIDIQIWGKNGWVGLEGYFIITRSKQEKFAFLQKNKRGRKRLKYLIGKK